MQVALLSVLSAQELVNYVSSHVKAFRSESEFPMDINDPFEEESSRGVFNFCLHFTEVVDVYHIFFFFIQIGQVNILRELRHSVWVIVDLLVVLWDLFKIFFLLFLASLGKYLLNSLCMNVLIAFLNWFFIKSIGCVFIWWDLLVVLLVICFLILNRIQSLHLVDALLRTDWLW